MEEPRIGVYICWCGTNIANMVDVEDVANTMAELENVIISRNYKYMCSDPGQELIIKDIKEHKLNRIVVSACSPRIHELTFRKALENAGLNPYLFEMANIREQVSWVHNDREMATLKAKSLVAAAIKRVNFHEELDKRSVEVNPATLVIGGGIAGMTAAIEIAESGNKVYLVERSSELGGIVSKIDLTFPYLYSGQQLINAVKERLHQNENIEVLLNTEVEDITGYIGNFETILPLNGKQQEIKFGNIIVATGLKPFDPGIIQDYGYGRLPDVVTALEFEEMLMQGSIRDSRGNDPKNVLIVHCVGSRNVKHHSYCSRTCCMTALKFSNQIRSALPVANIYQLYSDMRAIGKGCEELYTETGRRNVMFLMYDHKGDPPEMRRALRSENCNIVAHVHEKLSGEDIEIPADLVILMNSMEAHEDAKKVSHAVGISMCGNKFFIEKHPKLDPVATTTDGVYIAGSCQSPKDIPDAVSQARAAAARVLASISMGKVIIDLATAQVNEDLCCGCQTCISVCPYTAISFDEEKKVSVVNEILCKGCGTCGSACPTGAIKTRHFTDQQILSQIEGLLEKDKNYADNFETKEV